MRFFIQLMLLTCFCSTTPVVLAKSITVITNNAHPISHVTNKVRVINLDRAEELHEQLSLNLPSNPEQATQIAKARLSTSAKEIQMALQDIVDAWSLGVVKVPAVVVDNHVVYGVSDVTQAVALINDYQEQSQ